MTQTIALFVNAYRELNARKLFWVTLVLSGLVVLAFAMMGITETGIKIMVWEIDVPVLNTNVISKETFYKSLFTGLGISIWLTWAATILALISTASIFPDFIGSGAIDLELSKPISRLRLFLTRFATGLLFVALQVAVFCVCSFLVIGWRGGAWEPGIFLAIPVVVCFFSYLFAICVLLGLLTRSTIAALLLTLLAWFFLFSIHSVESTFLMQRMSREQQLESLTTQIDRREIKLAELEQAAKTQPPPTGNGGLSAKQRADLLRQSLALQHEQQESISTSFTKWKKLHRMSMIAKTVLPKTGETVGLLERWLIDLAELPAAPEGPAEESVFDMSNAGSEVPVNQAVLQDLVEETRNRPALWIIGTSLLFEIAVIGAGAWVFCRRDF